ncbi:MAG: glycosyltransferase 87 family protein [Actinomycetes bacterium]
MLGTLAAMLGLAVVSAWIQAAYFGVNVAASLSYWGKDGWCPQGTSGLGAHCWGDYAAIRFSSLASLPVGPEAVYPVSSRLLRIPFFIVDSVAGFQTGLVLFMAVSIVCVLSPALWAVRGMSWANKSLVIVLGCVATAPFLITLDRGNMIALVVPVFLIFLLGLIRDQPWLAAWAVVVASTVKPQFAVLGLALIALRFWLPALLALLGSLVVTLVPYWLFFGSRGASALEKWIHELGSFSDSQSLSAAWPTNLSLPGALARSFGLGESLSVMIVVGLAGLVTIAVLARGPRLHPLLIGTVFMVMASLVSPISYAYYGVFLIPLVAVIFRLGPRNWPRVGSINQAITVLMTAGIVLGLTPLLIPTGKAALKMDTAITTQPGTALIVGSLVPLLAAIAWLALFVAVIVRAIWMEQTTEPGATPSAEDLPVSTRVSTQESVANGRF